MKKVLVVDDDHATLQIAEQMLSNQGYDVLTVSDGKQVIRTLESDLPDVLVMDIFMPGCDGLENIMSIRSFNKQLPIIAITSAPDYMQIAKGLGADEAVLKPLYRSNLLDLVAQLSH